MNKRGKIKKGRNPTNHGIEENELTKRRKLWERKYFKVERDIKREDVLRAYQINKINIWKPKHFKKY